MKTIVENRKITRLQQFWEIRFSHGPNKRLRRSTLTQDTAMQVHHYISLYKLLVYYLLVLVKILGGRR